MSNFYDRENTKKCVEIDVSNLYTFENVSRKDTPSSEQIARYWYEWGQNRYKNKLTYPKFIESLLIDYGEPECWACGKYYDNFEQLQRHHIIPFSRNGSNHPSNFVLICDFCHENIPHTTIVEKTVTWLNNREDALNEENKIKFYSAIKHLGISEADGIGYGMIFALVLSKDKLFDSYSNENSVPAFFQYPFVSTMSCVIEFVKQNTEYVIDLLNGYYKDLTSFDGFNDFLRFVEINNVLNLGE